MPVQVQANWDVPHCKIEETSDGFKIRLRRFRAPSPLTTLAFGVWLFGGIVGLSIASPLIGGFGTLVLFVIWVGLFLMLAWVTTNIEVTKDAVIIDGKRLIRDDFGGFRKYSSMTAKNKTWDRLGYSYGTQTFPFGGMWNNLKSAEFVSGLNRRLARTPRDGAEEDTATVARPMSF